MPVERRSGRRDDPAFRVEGRPPAELAELSAGNLVPGVVGGANERPRLDMAEAEGERLGLELGELVGVVVALNREVFNAGAQVLADGEDVAVDLAEGRERLGAALPAPRLTRPSASSWCGPDSRSRAP